MGVKAQPPYMVLKGGLFNKESTHNNYYEGVSPFMGVVPQKKIMRR